MTKKGIEDTKIRVTSQYQTRNSIQALLEEHERLCQENQYVTPRRSISLAKSLRMPLPLASFKRSPKFSPKLTNK
jgi:hypothetical protein